MEVDSLALACVSPIRSPSYQASLDALGPEVIEACRANSAERLKELLNIGGEVNYKDHRNVTPLYSACCSGSIACVKLLLDNGADANELCGKHNDQTPLLVSTKYNHPACVQLLLEKGGASITTQWQSLVEEAISGDYATCLSLLLEHGGKVDFADGFGSTPLHLSAKYAKLACAEILLNYGANIDAKDMYNMTAYDIAIAKGIPWAKVFIKDGEFLTNNTNNHTHNHNHYDHNHSQNQSQNHSQNQNHSYSQNSSSSQIGYLSQSLSQNIDEDEKPANLSTILYHDISTVQIESTPSLPFSVFESSQLSQYSQQSQLGSQDLHPTHPPRYVRPNFEIDLSDLEIMEEVGSGFYGKVFRGIWQSGTPVAVKQLTSGDGKIGELTRKNFRLEMEMLMALRHPNIVLFLGVSIESPNLYLVMEFMPRGSLAHVLHGDTTVKTLGMKARIRMAMDVACGMNYLHKQTPEPILHRDLKSSNLLVTEDLRIKVSDFGLARVKDGRFRPRNPLDITIQAPEVLRSKPTRYTEKSDIYSFGLLLWELVTVQPVFADMEPKQIAAAVLKKTRPTIPSFCPSSLSVLMSRCWDEDPQVRPTFHEIVKELRPLVIDADKK